MIRRLYVEKKPPFADEADSLLRRLREYCGLNVEYVRVLNRYDVENLDDECFETAKTTVFSEPVADIVYEEEFPVSEGEHVLELEYLPGQYNQRADSAEQCLMILSEGAAGVRVESGRVYVLTGELDESGMETVKRLLLNPVDSREASGEKPDTLETLTVPPPPVPATEDYSMFDGDDAELVRRYFELEEKRPPTVTELKVLETYWSDHCRHTTFLTELESVTFDDAPSVAPIRAAYEDYLEARRRVSGGTPSPVSLMNIATMGMKVLKREGKLEDMDESPEVNACSIRVDVPVDGEIQQWLVMFKNETHNHPTEIEPFGGAATCLGGAIRDPLSGRSYVYQAMRVTGSGDPRAALTDTLPGKLPQSRIAVEAAQGFSSYGNQIGLATGHVAEIYHPGFIAKRMEIGAVVGAAPLENVRRVEPSPGDVIMLVGGRTGRDGCGGATGSSKAHDERSIETCGAEVQKGNPVTERKLQRLFRRPEAARLIKRCNDFGAGGVAVAVGELADSLDIDLDAVRKKYEGLDGTELAISESQERMAVVLGRDDAEAFAACCGEENLEAYIIASVTDSGRLRMFWRGETVVDLDRAFLGLNGAKRTVSARIAAPEIRNAPYTEFGKDMGLAEKWRAVLGELNVCSQKGLVERFDSTIGSGTVLMPYGGRARRTPAQVSVSKLPVRSGGTDTATMLAYGCDPVLSGQSPFHGAVYAVVESLAKLAAAGGDWRRARLSLQEYFEKLGKDEAKWGKPLAGLLGAYHAQRMTGIPAIGGKDSMSGTFGDIHVPPVVCSFALTVADAREVISPECKSPGGSLRYIELPKDENGLPDFGQLKTRYTAVYEAIRSGRIAAAYAVGGYGMAEALIKMLAGNHLGADLTDISEELLFAPQHGGILAEMADNGDFPYGRIIGAVTSKPEITLPDRAIELSSLIEVWEAPLAGVYPVNPQGTDAAEEHALPSEPSPEPTGPPPSSSALRRSLSAAARRRSLSAAARRRSLGAGTACPRVLIPVFPGTNCETDTRRAFEREGAVVEELVFRNLNPRDIGESLAALSDAIGRVQILALAGGFSAGDEPDGSAKFIAAVLRSPRVAEAVETLLTCRDGLILGICNGFQALVKTGLLPYGRIGAAGSCTLTHNAIGRHISQIVPVRVVGSGSPWLNALKPGDIRHVALSHGEGRFIAPEDELAAMFASGQVATVYEGANPNGSQGGVEGLISPCGRVFGRMGHPERAGAELYKNCPGNYEHGIFASGVGYFN